jgi:hypothetical protein
MPPPEGDRRPQALRRADPLKVGLDPLLEREQPQVLQAVRLASQRSFVAAMPG